MSPPKRRLGLLVFPWLLGLGVGPLPAAFPGVAPSYLDEARTLALHVSESPRPSPLLVSKLQTMLKKVYRLAPGLAEFPVDPLFHPQKIFIKLRPGVRPRDLVERNQRYSVRFRERLESGLTRLVFQDPLVTPLVAKDYDQHPDVLVAIPKRRRPKGLWVRLWRKDGDYILDFFEAPTRPARGRKKKIPRIARARFDPAGEMKSFYQDEANP